MTNSIMVMGGMGAHETVQVINCSTGTTFIGGYLGYPVRRTGGILVNGIQYLFGGRNSYIDYISTFQYLDLNTFSLETSTNSPISTQAITSTYIQYDTTKLCSNEDRYLNTTYDITVNNCINGVLEFISRLIAVIDVIYYDNELFVHSNISKQQRKELSWIDNNPFCDDITIYILTCFNESIDENSLINITKSDIFEQKVNDNIDTLSDLNETIIWIYIQNITIIYTNDTNTKPPKNTDTQNNIIWSLIGTLVSVCIILTIIIMCVKQKQKSDRYKSAIVIQNAMCIFIGIGEYDEDDVKDFEPDPELKHAMLTNLPIEKDIQNLFHIFGTENLNYSIYPRYEDIESPKIHWTRHEILSLLQEKAVAFDKSKHFDALLVVVSCHGISQNICTSDYKLLQKLAIHRMFSKNYFNARNKPRIMVFDCCQGIESHGGFVESIDCDKSAQNVKEIGKQFKESDIDQKYKSIWAYDTNNPDFKLVEINAANPGFQSKLDTRFGSYMVREFCQTMKQNLDNNANGCQRFLGEILDEVQNKLHSKQKKQLITALYNNGTRNIVFKRNKSNKTMTEMIQMDNCQSGDIQLNDKMDDNQTNDKMDNNQTNDLIIEELMHQTS
eukprot:137871_1